jgi:hypothetical protein
MQYNAIRLASQQATTHEALCAPRGVRMYGEAPTTHLELLSKFVYIWINDTVALANCRQQRIAQGLSL